jgi:hypothetical protein
MGNNNGEQAPKKAYESIKKAITELGSPSEYMYQYSDLDVEDIEDKKVAALFEGQKQVYHYGGEGQGEEYNTVWHFPVPDIYIRFYGWYASHSGAEYEGMQLVEPKQVLVTQFHTVK